MEKKYVMSEIATIKIYYTFFKFNKLLGVLIDSYTLFYYIKKNDNIK
jgi:hypothetical protein